MAAIRTFRIAATTALLCAAGFAQTTVRLGGTDYALQPHPRIWLDGPSGAATARLKDPDGMGPAVAPKATSANPAWAATIAYVASWTADGVYQAMANRDGLKDGNAALSAALVWYSDNSQTAAHDMALWLLDHVDSFVPLMCIPTIQGCGQSNYGAESYGATYWMMNWAQAYSIMRSELSPAERADFAAKMLNDIPAWGGVNGNTSISCADPTVIPSGLTFTGTVTGGVATITINSPLFGSQIQAGDWVMPNSPNTIYPARVISIVSSTQATLDAGSGTTYVWNTASATAFAYRSGVFRSGECGWMWQAKHERFNPNTVIGYPNAAYSDGGIYGSDYGHNLVYAGYRGFIALFLALADDDPNASLRAVPQLQALYGGWLGVLGVSQAQNTIYNQSGSGYGLGRAPMNVSTALMWQDSAAGFPSQLGQWSRNLLQQYYMAYFPGAPNGYLQWGQQGVDGAWLRNGTIGEVMMLARAHLGTPESAYLRYFIENIWTRQDSWFGGTSAGGNSGYTSANFSRNGGVPANIYLFNDPAYPSADLAGAPLQSAPDSQLGTQPRTVLVSRTGFTSLTDTLVMFYAMNLAGETDHGLGYNPGSYKIIKNAHLLSEDEGQPGMTADPAANAFSGYWQQSNYIQLGSDSNLSASSALPTMPRRKVSDNRYAYAMADLTTAYLASAGAQRVRRHLIDFKKAGAQQFVIVYDDVAVNGGKTLKTFLHYANNGQSYEGVTTFDGWDTIASYFPGTGHNDATQLLTKVLRPAGDTSVAVVTDNASGAYSGGNGQTYRVTVCASTDGSTCSGTATSAEFVVVHEPAVGTGNTMPPAALISTDANWRGVQVGGPNPKVALFARNGQMYTRAAFTSTHDGIAQIAVAGLKAGAYVITGGSAAVTGTVGDDGLLYFEGEAGAYLIRAATPPSAAAAGKIGAAGRVVVR